MVNGLDSKLQVFFNFINDKDTAYDADAAVQLDGEGKLGDATRIVGAARRKFCLMKSTAEACKANNDVRAKLLEALSAQYKGLDKIPESVMEALNYKAFGVVTKGEDKFVTSGKPLTRRRICRVLDAVKQDIEEQEEALRAAFDNYTILSGGKTRSDLSEKFFQEVKDDSDLVDEKGEFTSLGDSFAEYLQTRFTREFQSLHFEDKKGFVEKIDEKAVEFAKFVHNFKKEGKDRLLKIFKDQEVVKFLNSGDQQGSQPNDQCLEIRKHLLWDKLMGEMFFEGLKNSKNDLKTVLKLYEENVRNLISTTKASAPKAFISVENRVAVILGTLNALKQKWPDVEMPEKLVDVLILASEERDISAAQSDAERKERIEGLVKIFDMAMQSCGNDAAMAGNAFLLLMATKILNPAHAEIGLNMFKVVGSKNLPFPEDNSINAIRQFFEKEIGEPAFDAMQKDYDEYVKNGRGFSNGFSEPDKESCYRAMLIRMVVAKDSSAKAWLGSYDLCKLSEINGDIGKQITPELDELRKKMQNAIEDPNAAEIGNPKDEEIMKEMNYKMSPNLLLGGLSQIKEALLKYRL